MARTRGKRKTRVSTESDGNESGDYADADSRSSPPNKKAKAREDQARGLKKMSSAKKNAVDVVNVGSTWLMKAEPESRIEKGTDVKFSIDDLAATSEPEPWDGIRNSSAKNNILNMKKGDLAFFYHSNCKTPGIAGVMQIVAEHSVDETQFDPNAPYYDPKSSRDKPKWYVVHVRFVHKFENFISLKQLQEHRDPGEPLENLQTLRQSRLSVSSVSPEQWRFIIDLAGVKQQELLEMVRDLDSI